MIVNVEFIRRSVNRDRDFSQEFNESAIAIEDHGGCRAIGLSDISLDELLPIYKSARIKPAVVQVEAHPYLPETGASGIL